MIKDFLMTILNKEFHNSCEEGFTLLEVMVAMAILAASLTAVYQLQMQSISMSAESRFKTSAALLAQSKMQEIETSNSLNNRTENGDFGANYPLYSWRLEITDTNMQQLKKIIVTVLNKAYVNDSNYSLILYKTSGN